MNKKNVEKPNEEHKQEYNNKVLFHQVNYIDYMTPLGNIKNQSEHKQEYYTKIEKTITKHNYD